MSASDTRPPLFDPAPKPSPEGKSAPESGGASFSRNRKQKKGRKGGRSSGSNDSPGWVRPFIFGGLILVAVVSLVSIFTSGQDDAVTVTDDPPTDVDAVAADLGDALNDAAVVAEVDPTDPAGDATTPVQVDAEPDSQEQDDPDTLQAVADVTSDDVATTAVTGSESGASTTALEAFAIEFAFDYLNFRADQAAIREGRLAAYLAPGLDPQLGWDGQGAQAAVLTMPVQTTFHDRGATVVIASQVTGPEASQWVHLAIPIGVDDAGRLAVTAPPAYVPRPDPGDPPGPDLVIDDDLSTELAGLAEPFFQAFAARDVVNEDGITAVDADIRGLDGDVSLVSVGALRVLEGDGETRDARVNVTWLRDTAASQLTQTYFLTLTADGDEWLVQEINTR